MSNVAVVGAGYVGLTTAACLAHLGHDVVCADVDAERVRRLSKGEVPILEQRLPVLVAEGLETRHLRFVCGAAEAARGADVVFLCVPTPGNGDGSADLSYVENAAAAVAPVLEPEAIVVLKSTAPVGSTRRLLQVLEQAGAGHDVRVACNPEFLREGAAVNDFLHPDRIVIGCDDPAVAVRVSALYRGIQAPTLVTDPQSAELIKYASNAYLALRVSFVNALAAVCEAAHADVRDVTLGLGYDSRIGSAYLAPGPGFGGSCLPKDTAALLHTAERLGPGFAPLRSALEVNQAQQERIVEKIGRALGGDFEDARIAVWGLTFKANTDDLRDSPSVTIAERLVQRGCRVRAYDPVAAEQARGRLHGVEVVADPYEACEGAQVVALLTEWDELRWLDFARVRDAMANSAVVDARNLLDPATMRQHGFDYQGVGR